MSLACLVGMSIRNSLKWNGRSTVPSPPPTSGSPSWPTWCSASSWCSGIVPSSPTPTSANGRDPSFADGINAVKRLPVIILWGIVAGTVGLLLKALEGAARSSDNDVTRALATIVHIIGGLAWWVMTFFMIPHLVLEGKSLGDALKSSKATFFSTWGENITSGLGIGLVAVLIGIPLVVATIGLSLVMGPAGLLLGAISSVCSSHGPMQQNRWPSWHCTALRRTGRCRNSTGTKA